MKRVIIGILVTAYLLVAVFLTACLLTYNDYKISEFGDKSLIILDNKDFEPNYHKGALLIVQKNKNDDIKVNDEIFFYNTYKNQIVVSNSKVIKTEKITETQTTYTISGNYEISSDYVIGKASTTTVINNVGDILSFLESRWGFLLVIVLPISILFIYEIYVIIREIIRPEEKAAKKEKEDEPETKEEPEKAEEKVEPTPEKEVVEEPELEKETSKEEESKESEEKEEEPEEKAEPEVKEEQPEEKVESEKEE